MLSFENTSSGVQMRYESEPGSPASWVWNELESEGAVKLSRVFNFQLSDLINPPNSKDSIEDYEYCFSFGTFDGSYVRVPGRIFDIANDVLINRGMTMRRRLFAAERNISIFRRLSELLDHTDDIVVGGSRAGAIPESVFEELLSEFPNTHELNRYASARVHTILSQHLHGMRDARGAYERYLNKSARQRQGKLSLDVLKDMEVQKYIFIRDAIQSALKKNANLSEKQWQQLMIQFLTLLFPKYVKVLENVTINDYYSNEAKKTSRFLDVALVDANGNLDVIEIKKPFEDKILSKSIYRGNSIPTSELSGSIMQAEKYLFHLSKWGVDGERVLSKKYASELPHGMEIRISNPKAIIILGRDQIGGAGMSRSQLLDFEVIKRKYANMLDIITYDDLLRRLNNTIAALQAK